MHTLDELAKLVNDYKDLNQHNFAAEELSLMWAYAKATNKHFWTRLPFIVDDLAEDPNACPLGLVNGKRLYQSFAPPKRITTFKEFVQIMSGKDA